jgi:predicted DNA-binding transcriptional regulator AlpA
MNCHEELDAYQCAHLAGVSHSTWHKLVKAGKAPAPLPENRRRWNKSEVVAWANDARNVPTIAEIEADVGCTLAASGGSRSEGGYNGA